MLSYWTVAVALYGLFLVGTLYYMSDTKRTTIFIFWVLILWIIPVLGILEYKKQMGYPADIEVPNEFVVMKDLSSKEKIFLWGFEKGSDIPRAFVKDRTKEEEEQIQKSKNNQGVFQYLKPEKLGKPIPRKIVPSVAEPKSTK